MTRAIDRVSSSLAAPAGKWCTDHLVDIMRLAGGNASELLGYVYEIALIKQRKGALTRLTATRAVKLARKRIEDEYVVCRPRGEARPQVTGGDAVDLIAGTDTPLDRLVEIESQAEEDDHDDRLSWEAKRAVAGRQPVEFPRIARESAARQARRFRVHARDLRDSGQRDFWDDWGEAA